MKNKILSVLGSIIITSFFIGYGVFLATGHIELMAISGSIVLFILFYVLIKWLLDECKGE